MPHHKNIALIGFSGSGKSLLGKRLAEESNRIFIDTDILVEQFHPFLSCKEIYQSYGSDYFRYLESRVILQIEKYEGPLVIATGGGTLTTESNGLSLKKHAKLVFLRTPSAVLMKRLLKRASHPAYLTELDFDELLSQRTALYEKWADEIWDQHDQHDQQDQQDASYIEYAGYTKK